VGSYRTEYGELPEALSVLLPDYITAVPTDPNGDGPLIYRITGDGYQLYSVGADGDDDGGRPMKDQHSEGDFFVDTQYERQPTAPALPQTSEEETVDPDELQNEND